MANAIVRHIRKSNANVTDHRFRFAVQNINKMTATICGVAPTIDDRSRKDAAHIIEHFAAIKPEWIAELCPACRGGL